VKALHRGLAVDPRALAHTGSVLMSLRAADCISFVTSEQDLFVPGSPKGLTAQETKAPILG
jgi:hypothetical protein